MGGTDTAGAEQGVNSAQAAVEAAQAAYNDAVAKAALRAVKAPADGSNPRPSTRKWVRISPPR